jgi:CRP-like cAMP-binding protein/Fe-S-cluster-containing hydrogenase component 2
MGVPIAEARLEHGTPLSPADLIKLSIFQGINEATLQKFPGAIVYRKFKKGEVVCREGEFGSTAFYILSGKVEVSLQTSLAHVRSQKAESLFGGGLRRFLRRFASRLVGRDDDPIGDPTETPFIPIDAPVDLPLQRPIAQLKEGDLFGEMTCLNFYPRSATVRALEDCEALEMLRNILTLLQKRSTILKPKLDAVYKERALTNHLRSHPAFKSVPDEAMAALRDRVELVSFDPGEVVVKQGDPADAMYLIRLGFVKVTQTYPAGEIVLRYLHRGEFLGALGILGEGVRTATCTALSAVELVKIHKQDVEAMVARYPDVRRNLERDRVQTRVFTREKVGTFPTVSLGEFLEQGLMEAQNLLMIDLDRCTRCDDCVRACADSHDGVTRLIRDGLRYDKYLVATSCRSCADPLCMVGCPVGSIRRRGTLEIVIEDWCIGCGLCAKQCPYGNINMHSFSVAKADPADPARKVAAVESKATTCDLCLGMDEPSCVYACPHDAALRVDPRKFFAAQLMGKAD